MNMKLRKLTEHTGAEVLEINLAHPLDDAAILGIRRALVEHCVLVFRDQDIALDEQIAFSERFGLLEDFPEKVERSKASAKVFCVSNIDESGTLFGAEHIKTKYLRVVEYWHTDSSYRRIPSLYSTLFAVQVPDAKHGGQTEWANMVAAYDALPAAMRDRIATMKAIHQYAQTRVMVLDLPPLTEAERTALPPVLHPVVRTHPDSGKRSLFISAHSPRIEGLPAGEGEALLYELLGHATQPKFVYRHFWRKGDLVVWENRHSIHRLIPYDATQHRRVMHRTCVGGTEPVT